MFLDLFTAVIYIHLFSLLPLYKHLFKLIRGTLLFFVLEHSVHTYSAINLSRKEKDVCCLEAIVVHCIHLSASQAAGGNKMLIRIKMEPSLCS